MATFTRICTRIPEGGTGRWVECPDMVDDRSLQGVEENLDDIEKDLRRRGLEPSQINLKIHFSVSALVHSSTAEWAVADDEAPR